MVGDVSLGNLQRMHKANASAIFGSSGGGVATGSFSQASSTALNNVTGLSTRLSTGVYVFNGYLSTTNIGTGGIKLSLNGGTAAASQFLCDAWVYNTTTLTNETNTTSLASNIVNAAVASTAVEFSGSITVSTGGVLQLQAAQNTSNGTALTVANGSYIVFTRIG